MESRKGGGRKREGDEINEILKAKKMKEKRGKKES